MNSVYISSSNIITSLGFTTLENVNSIRENITGIKQIHDNNLYTNPVSISLINSTQLENKFLDIASQHQTSNIKHQTSNSQHQTSNIKHQTFSSFTRFEKMLIVSITDALLESNIDLKDPKSAFILSTTKGNIDLLEKAKKNKFDPQKLNLWHTANLVKSYFGNENKPLVISNACISGVIAIITGAWLIQTGQYDNVVISGGDILSEFIISGFQSFLSLSSAPCKPFDINRNGLSFGEGCGTIILTSNKDKIKSTPQIVYNGGATSNDANHISGPSRTGDGALLAINKALQEAKLSPAQVGYISAHGTATPYNDEMESKAIAAAGMINVPVNSFKGYFGHTLGAAGIIESILSIESLKNDILFNTLGYEQSGLSENINVINKNTQANLQHVLKIASGFGGCNAAIVFSKLP